MSKVLKKCAKNIAIYNETTKQFNKILNNSQKICNFVAENR